MDRNRLKSSKWSRHCVNIHFWRIFVLRLPFEAWTKYIFTNHSNTVYYTMYLRQLPSNWLSKSLEVFSRFTRIFVKIPIFWLKSRNRISRKKGFWFHDFGMVRRRVSEIFELQAKWIHFKTWCNTSSNTFRLSPSVSIEIKKITTFHW